MPRACANVPTPPLADSAPEAQRNNWPRRSRTVHQRANSDVGDVNSITRYEGKAWRIIDTAPKSCRRSAPANPSAAARHHAGRSRPLKLRGRCRIDCHASAPELDASPTQSRCFASQHCCPVAANHKQPLQFHMLANLSQKTALFRAGSVLGLWAGRTRSSPQKPRPI